MILERIIDWIKRNDNVLALILTGSQASSYKVDEFSDYDVEIIAKNPEKLAKGNEWFHKFGQVIVYLSLNEGQDYPTILVIYKKGIKVDFTLANEKRLLKMKRKGLDELYERGYKILVDKKGVTKKLPKASGKLSNKRPAEKEYFRSVNEFWFETAHIPKLLLREDLWVVKFRDWTMKKLLLKMLELHTISKNPKQDIRWVGSKMKDWLAPDLWQETQNVFARFDVKDSWRGMLATIDLFRKTSREVANNFNFKYPEELDRNITSYVTSYKHRFKYHARQDK